MTWDQDDQDKALAWQIDNADKCPGCGTRSYEASEFTVGEILCRVCQSKQLKEAEVHGHRPPAKPGKYVVLRRRDGST